MDNSTTNIHSLPTPSSENIMMNITSQPQQQQQPPPMQSSIDQETMNEILNGLQSAGTTQLPSRDIPQHTTSHTIDNQIQPNYVPQSDEHGYVENDIIEDKHASVKFASIDERFYNEIQGPLMFAILYFIFQLPIVKKTMFVYLPFLFMNDGNINLYGYVSTSILFGITCFILAKTIISFK